MSTLQENTRNLSYISLENFLLCREDAKNPSFWSRVCLHNMAKLATEATTMRRILESLFRYFDNENLWPVSRGVAFPVLKDMQTIIDESGTNDSRGPFIYYYYYFFLSPFTSNNCYELGPNLSSIFIRRNYAFSAFCISQAS